MITIDTREKKHNRERAKRFFSQHDIRSEQVKLDHGDYLIHGKILVERKAASDFVSSFSTLAGGRHSSFLCHCAEYGFTPVLLLEGRPLYINGHATYQTWETNMKTGRKKRVNKWTKVTQQQMDNFCFSAANHGTLLYHTKDFTDTLEVLKNWSKYDLLHPHPLNFSPKMTNSERLVSFWSMFKGVGKVTAEKLAKYDFSELSRMTEQTRNQRFGKSVMRTLDPIIGKYEYRKR